LLNWSQIILQQMSSMLAPIALFVYNRPSHLRKTLEALEKNLLADESELFIYADGFKSDMSEEVKKRIDEVRQLIRKPWGFKDIHIKEKKANFGLANSIIGGVSELVNQFGKVIVLEDDLVTAPGFLKYMNDALDKYRNEPTVMQISGYQFPIDFPTSTPETFFLPLTTSWGWATWKRAWDMFDPKAKGWEELKTNSELRNRFDLCGSYPYSQMLENQMEYKTIDSWAIRWWWSVFRNNGMTLFCNKSLIINVGFDEFSSHTRTEPFKQNTGMLNKEVKTFSNIINSNLTAYKQLKKFLAIQNKTKSNSIWSYLFLKITELIK
jgi:hypothetical protein